MLMQWNYNYYCFYYFYHAWFEVRVWPTIHKTVSAHSCKEAGAGMNSIFQKECRGTKEGKERRKGGWKGGTDRVREEILQMSH